ncbi:MAG: DUF805 domain-containing protein [Rhodospirillales bacterium]|nr:DUF805 domain-containing protein [Rhodospirillales bacterium]
MSDTTICQACGTPLPPTAQFCPACGAPCSGSSRGDGIPRSFGISIQICLRKYASFAGRAPRAEYWWFVLFEILVQLAANMIDHALETTPPGLVGPLASLALLLPALAVAARRLHDIDRSAWWLLLYLVPVVGWLVLLVWHCTRGTRGPNRFGPENGAL